MEGLHHSHALSAGVLNGKIVQDERQQTEYLHRNLEVTPIWGNDPTSAPSKSNHQDTPPFGMRPPLSLGFKFFDVRYTARWHYSLLRSTSPVFSR